MTHVDFPEWLHNLSIASIGVACVCAITISVDEMRRPQRMWIMNWVWPLTSLFGSVIWLALYATWGRAPAPFGKSLDAPLVIRVAKGTSHCGAGCVLGDIIAEWTAALIPSTAVWFGWQRIFQEKTFAVWVMDYVLAFLLGIAFQYFTIKPMRDLSVREGLLAAIKADAGSITAWQIGMYGLMALIQFGWFQHAFGHPARVASPEFWFAMQLAMLAGFATSFPINCWLLRIGLKEAM